jgi:hypothetical protein
LPATVEFRKQMRIVSPAASADVLLTIRVAIQDAREG